MGTDDLIQKCVKQEHSAQKELYTLYYGDLMAFCLRMSSNREEAISLFQDGFIRIYKDIREEKINLSLSKWIKLKMVYNTVALLRKNIQQHIISSTGRGGDQNHSEQNDFTFVNSLSEEQLITALQQLPVIYRILINLTYIDALSSSEIAKLVDMSEGTLFTNTSKAEFSLKIILEKNYLKSNESEAS